MPDKIGIIGNTQGVNESNKPKPKKLANTHKILSCCNKAVILSVYIPLTNIESSQVSFIAKFQGCWLGGICYPPVEKSTDITLPEVTRSLNRKMPDRQVVAHQKLVSPYQRLIAWQI
jgi:thiol:disulfide interchange protein